jgi:hypothetical protein
VPSPLTPLRRAARVAARIDRDIESIAQAARSVPEIARAVAPVPELIAQLRASPELRAAWRSLPALVSAVQRLPAIADAIEPLPVIERTILALAAALEPALADVHRLHEIVDLQQNQVSHIEQMLERVERRSAILEQAILDLQSKADEAMRALPDPDDDRGAIARARDALTGTS